MTDSSELNWVATEAALDALVTALDGAPLLAVDTEFIREKTYYPKLCLIQIATDGVTACVDCLAPVDLAPLFAKMFDPASTWVLHSARQDLEVIWQLTQHLPPRLIDTQVAAALAGFPPQVGLEGLLKRALGIELGESYARTDWSRRPLPDAAFRYALDDVRYLLPAWRQVEGQLAALGRLSWLEEDSRRLLDEPPVADPLAIWSRLKGLYALPLRGQCAALSLVRWRETAAQRADRPRRWLLADETLLALAASLPSTQDELGKFLPAKFAARAGRELLAALAARSDPEIEAIVRERGNPQAPDKARLKALQEDVRQRAAALGIEPEILATRRDLAALELGAPPEHLRKGWRAQALESGLRGPLPGSNTGRVTDPTSA
ncbi:MAG TPA: HRDC domain-containing protein [Gammaproteobacteria bacterium]|nr:HRDC domain-containing protein [Gammaproteobacteria bacterium]